MRLLQLARCYHTGHDDIACRLEPSLQGCHWSDQPRSYSCVFQLHNNNIQTLSYPCHAGQYRSFCNKKIFSINQNYSNALTVLCGSETMLINEDLIMIINCVIHDNHSVFPYTHKYAFRVLKYAKNKKRKIITRN